jgi:carboxymethylenebutenolidase
MRDSAPWRTAAIPPDGGGYLAVPAAGRGPGVIVIHEWWGLNDQVVRTCDRFAAEGFVALAPDLFAGRCTDVAAEGRELSTGLEEADGVARTLGAVDHLTADPRTTGERLGVVGYCMGGGYVYHAATSSRVGAASPFYGLPKGAFDPATVRCPILGHYGTQDQVTTPAAARDLAARIQSAAGAVATIREYPGAAHAFCNEDGATHSPANAAQAWAATLTFLRQHLT